ncbi:MAG: hypothetical protein UX00_C0007G0195 [Microgenomates group bacterium GW2011_GWB1_45_17]|nr:MAG: hypothetical protein UX00_C0007G0195 [Microgenomates group bacterium GW2011_GWB1_45_17]
MKKYFSIWLHFAKISLQRLFEYRADFFLWSLVSTGWTIFSLLFYQILFLQTSNIAGWNKQQMLVFAGTYMIIDAATWSIFWRNIQNYTESIFNGTLDFLLLQPIDAQFRLSVRHISFTNVPRLIIGIILLALNLPTVTLSQGRYAYHYYSARAYYNNTNAPSSSSIPVARTCRTSHIFYRFIWSNPRVLSLFNKKILRDWVVMV